MADINIERRGPSVWPWVIGLLVLALLIWGLVEMFGDSGEPVIPDTAADSVTINTGTSTVPIPPVTPPLPSDTATMGDNTSVPADTVGAVAAP